MKRVHDHRHVGLDLIPGTTCEKPVVGVRVHSNLPFLQEGCHHRHAFRDDSGGCGQAERENRELVAMLVYHKPEEASVCWMNSDMKVCVLHVKGSVPIPRIQRGNNNAQGDHVELELDRKFVVSAKV